MYEFRFVHQHGYISGEYGKVVTKQNRYGRYFVFRTLNNEEIPLKKQSPSYRTKQFLFTLSRSEISVAKLSALR